MAAAKTDSSVTVRHAFKIIYCAAILERQFCINLAIKIK